MERGWLMGATVVLVAVVLAANIPRCGNCNRVLWPGQGHGLTFGNRGRIWSGSVCDDRCEALLLGRKYHEWDGAAVRAGGVRP